MSPDRVQGPTSCRPTGAHDRPARLTPACAALAAPAGPLAGSSSRVGGAAVPGGREVDQLASLVARAATNDARSQVLVAFARRARRRRPSALGPRRGSRAAWRALGLRRHRLGPRRGAGPDSSRPGRSSARGRGGRPSRRRSRRRRALRPAMPDAGPTRRGHATCRRTVSNDHIARSVDVSEHTVRTHLTSVIAKKNSTSCVHALIFAYDQGLVHPRREATSSGGAFTAPRRSGSALSAAGRRAVELKKRLDCLGGAPNEC